MKLSTIIAATMAIAGYPLKLVDEALTITPRPAPKRKLSQADRDALAKAEAKRARKAKRGGIAR